MNIIEIGESMEYVAFRVSGEGLSIDEICGITYLSDETACESIKKYSKQVK